MSLGLVLARGSRRRVSAGKEKGAPEDRRAKGEKGVEEEDQRLLMASLTWTASLPTRSRR